MSDLGNEEFENPYFPGDDTPAEDVASLASGAPRADQQVSEAPVVPEAIMSEVNQSYPLDASPVPNQSTDYGTPEEALRGAFGMTPAPTPPGGPPATPAEPVEEAQGLSGDYTPHEVSRGAGLTPDPMLSTEAGSVHELERSLGILRDQYDRSVTIDFSKIRRGGRPGETMIRLMDEFELKTPLDPRYQPIIDALRAQAQQAASAAAALRLANAGEEADAMESTAEQLLADALHEHDIMEDAIADSKHEMNGIRASINQLATSRVNPEHFWTSRGAAASFGGALAIAAGAMAQALNPGTQNTALAIINSAIDRDIQAQQANVDIRRSEIGARMNLLGAMRQVYQDEAAAITALKLTRLKVAEQRLGAMAHRNAALQQGADSLAAALQQQMASLMEQLEASRVTHHMKFNRAFSQSGLERYINNVQYGPPRSQPEAGGSQAQAPRRRDGSPRSTTRPPRMGTRPQIMDNMTEAQARALAAEDPALVAVEHPDRNGSWTILNADALQAQKQEDVVARQERQVGVQIPGIEMDDAVMNRMSARMSPEAVDKERKFITNIPNLWNMWSRIERIAEEAGGWETFGEATNRVQGILTRIYTNVNSYVNAGGVLNVSDIEFMRELAENPTKLTAPYAESRMREFLLTLEEEADNSLRAWGGRYLRRNNVTLRPSQTR